MMTSVVCYMNLFQSKEFWYLGCVNNALCVVLGPSGMLGTDSIFFLKKIPFHSIFNNMFYVHFDAWDRGAPESGLLV